MWPLSLLSQTILVAIIYLTTSKPFAVNVTIYRALNISTYLTRILALGVNPIPVDDG